MLWVLRRERDDEGEAVHYTVLGMTAFGVTLDVFAARPGQGIDVAYTARRKHGHAPDWSLVAVLSGRHRLASLYPPLAVEGDSAPGPGGGRRAKVYTVVGRWRWSGETIREEEQAMSGDQALGLVLRLLGEPEEIDFLVAFNGKVSTPVRSEHLPVNFL